MLIKSNSQPSAGRAPISNPGMDEAGNFGGNNFIQANGLTVVQNQVLNLIKACPRPEGLNFQDLKNQLQHMSVASIKLAVDFLSKEGHIYSTVDDDHFKSTDTGSNWVPEIFSSWTFFCSLLSSAVHIIGELTSRK